MTQTHGELAEERGGPTRGRDVSGIRLYCRPGAEAAACAAGDRAVQEARADPHESDARSQNGSENERTDSLSSGLARQLREVSDAFVVATAGGVAQASTAVGDLTQWKRGTVRFGEMRKRSVGHDLAAQTAG